MNNALFEGARGEKIKKAIFVAIVMLGVYLGIRTLSEAMSTFFSAHSELETYGLGYGNTSIAVVGHGEVVGVPDVATFTFSVLSEKLSVADAQNEAGAKANAITAYLGTSGVDAKDIQTSDYSISPQYDYAQAPCQANAYCPSKQVLRGYQVRQTTTVKVRDTKKAGDILAGVGSKGATDVSGLTFTFADTDALKTQARDKAIVDAKAKAQVLAKQLGVSIVNIAQYSEGAQDEGAPAPMAYGVATMAGAKAVAPDISLGQNKVTADVTITYSVR